MIPILLILQLSPNDLEPALALIYQNEVTTLEEKRIGRALQLRLKIPKGLSSDSLIKKLQDQEKKLGKRVFTKFTTKTLQEDSWN